MCVRAKRARSTENRNSHRHISRSMPAVLGRWDRTRPTDPARPDRDEHRREQRCGTSTLAVRWCAIGTWLCRAHPNSKMGYPLGYRTRAGRRCWATIAGTGARQPKRQCTRVQHVAVSEVLIRARMSRIRLPLSIPLIMRVCEAYTCPPSG